MSRYSFAKAICCCCVKKRGTLEKDKEELIKEMLGSQDTGPAFDRYCTLPYRYFRKEILKKEAAARKFQKKLKEKKEMLELEEQKQLRLSNLNQSLIMGSAIQSYINAKKQDEARKKKEAEEKKKLEEIKENEEEDKEYVDSVEEDEEGNIIVDESKKKENQIEEKKPDETKDLIKWEDVQEEPVFLSEDSDNDIDIGDDGDDKKEDEGLTEKEKKEKEEKRKQDLEKKRKEALDLLKYQMEFKESELRPIEYIEPVKGYKGNTGSLGIDRPKNVMLRLKEGK